MTDPIDTHAADLQRVMAAHEIYVEAEYAKIRKYVAAVRKDLTVKSLLVNKRVTGFLQLLIKKEPKLGPLAEWADSDIFVPADPLEMLADVVDDDEYGPETTEGSADSLEAAVAEYHGEEAEEEDDEDEEDDEK